MSSIAGAGVAGTHGTFLIFKFFARSAPVADAGMSVQWICALIIYLFILLRCRRRSPSKLNFTASPRMPINASGKCSDIILIRTRQGNGR